LNVISVFLLLTFRIRVSGIGEGEAIQNDSSFLSGNNVGIEKKSLFPVGCFALFFLFLGWDEDDDGKLCGEKFFAFSQTENHSLVIDLHICGFLCENRRYMRINMQKVFPAASGNHFFHPFFAKKG